MLFLQFLCECIPRRASTPDNDKKYDNNDDDDGDDEDGEEDNQRTTRGRVLRPAPFPAVRYLPGAGNHCPASHLVRGIVLATDYAADHATVAHGRVERLFILEVDTI